MCLISPQHVCNTAMFISKRGIREKSGRKYSCSIFNTYILWIFAFFLLWNIRYCYPQKESIPTFIITAPLSLYVHLQLQSSNNRIKRSSNRMKTIAACDRCDIRTSFCKSHSKYNYTCECRNGYAKNTHGECIGLLFVALIPYFLLSPHYSISFVFTFTFFCYSTKPILTQLLLILL